MLKTVSEIRSVESETGIISTLIHNPEYIFSSDVLKKDHFSNAQNGIIYEAIDSLVKRGIETIDSYNLCNAINAVDNTNKINPTEIDEFIDLSGLVVRNSVEEYNLLVDIVVKNAFKRNLYKKLIECEGYCLQDNEDDISQKVYNVLDEAMLEFRSNSKIPQYKDIVDDVWNEIKERQGKEYVGMTFKYPTLNKYVTIEPGELIIFAADTKVGKSMLLLNCAVDLLRKNIACLYIDSELNTRLFTIRIISHLTGIEFSRVKSGRYSKEEEKKIDECRDWLKTRKFTHIYIPIFDSQSIYTAVKKVKHTQGLDVLIIDYFKSKSDSDAFGTYNEMGRLVDLVKNQICGDMNIAGIGAAQATSTGKIADSAKIGRNASTIGILERKTPSEIEKDGRECGNTKLRIVLNRNGMQMASDEYIDLQFNGNIISYEEAKQHKVEEPY